MKPGQLAFIYQRNRRGERELEGFATLITRLRPDTYGTGCERWSVQTPNGETRAREIHPDDVLEDRAQLEEELERRKGVAR